MLVDVSDESAAIADAVCVLLSAGADFEALAEVLEGAGFEMVPANDEAKVVH